jgi:hypothetical protein
MPAIPRFVIFYADGSVVKDDGEDVEVVFKVPKIWAEAPKDGVQFVVEHLSDDKLRVYQQYDHYFVLPGGQPKGAKSTDPMLRNLGILKHGLWIPDEEFEEIREAVQEYRRKHENK